MIRLLYVNDGKGKAQSHELYMEEDFDIPGTYGENLSEALEEFTKSLIDKKGELDELLDAVSERYVEFVDSEGNVIFDEEVTNSWDGSRTSKSIQDAIAERYSKKLINSEMGKISLLIENMVSIINGSGDMRWSTEKKNKLIKFFRQLKEKFYQTPNMVVIHSQKTLQLTWKLPNELFYIVKVKANAIESYISFRNVSGNRSNISIQVDTLDDVMTMITLFKLYKA